MPFFLFCPWNVTYKTLTTLFTYNNAETWSRHGPSDADGAEIFQFAMPMSTSPNTNHRIAPFFLRASAVISKHRFTQAVIPCLDEDYAKKTEVTI